MTLHDWWHRTWSDLRQPVPSGVLEQLLARYSEAHRAYHTVQHLEECLELLDRVSHLASHLGEVQVALWFHDAIYDPRRTDNEERSADACVEVLVAAGVSPETRQRVRELVLATKHDREPESADARLTVDVDLAILGAAPDRFDEYEAQVRREYAWVPELAFRHARAKILRQFLARPSIYATDFFRERLEERARLNLTRSLTNQSPSR
jgi:predicted metal-dependent HD superfamily phosphohydrolase